LNFVVAMDSNLVTSQAKELWKKLCERRDAERVKREGSQSPSASPSAALAHGVPFSAFSTPIITSESLLAASSGASSQSFDSMPAGLHPYLKRLRKWNGKYVAPAVCCRPCFCPDFDSFTSPAPALSPRRMFLTAFAHVQSVRADALFDDYCELLTADKVARIGMLSLPAVY
jgi:hypothetical protein